MLNEDEIANNQIEYKRTKYAWLYILHIGAAILHEMDIYFHSKYFCTRNNIKKITTYMHVSGGYSCCNNNAICISIWPTLHQFEKIK